MFSQMHGTRASMVLAFLSACWLSLSIATGQKMASDQVFEISIDGKPGWRSTPAPSSGVMTPDARWQQLRTIEFASLDTNEVTPGDVIYLNGKLTLRVNRGGVVHCDQLVLLHGGGGWRLHPADVRRTAIARTLPSDAKSLDAQAWQLPRVWPSRRAVIAHRGACGYLPEHTQASACLAYGLGADYIEQDVVLTQDRVPIVLHDIHLDTVTNVAERFPGRARKDGRYYALDFTWAEIQTLDAHERTSHKANATGQQDAVFPNRFPLGKSQFRLASLAQMIELIQGLNRSTGRHVGVYPELKHPTWHREQNYDLTAVTLEMLSFYGYQDHHDAIYVQCFEPGELMRIRNEFKSELPLIQLIDDDDFGDALWSPEGLAKVSAYADAVGPSLDRIFTVSKDARVSINPSIEAAHRCGLLVHPWTVRADSLPKYVESIEELMSLCDTAQLDGFFTDFPDRTSSWPAH